jgi:LuxR family transcriptional regulator, maltose regulon positive regulatory protein
LSVDDEPDYLRELEHLTLARALVARFAADGDEGSITGAVRLLDRLLDAAEQGGRAGNVLDGLVVLALAESARGRTAEALAAVRRALALAEPGGYVRIFLDEGAPVTDLLAAVASSGSDANYARRLLASHGSAAGGAAIPRPRVDGVPAQEPEGLAEPLSARELDVLQLLGTDLDGPDIARRLFVSLNTVRTHTKNIYAKLGVNNRRAAVRRAQELGLTARHGTTIPRRAVVQDA